MAEDTKKDFTDIILKRLMFKMRILESCIDVILLSFKDYNNKRLDEKVPSKSTVSRAIEFLRTLKPDDEGYYASIIPKTGAILFVTESGKDDVVVTARDIIQGKEGVKKYMESVDGK